MLHTDELNGKTVFLKLVIKINAFQLNVNIIYYIMFVWTTHISILFKMYVTNIFTICILYLHMCYCFDLLFFYILVFFVH